MGNVFTGSVIYGVAGPKETFLWRIEGFSSLSKLPDASYASRPFEFGGYSWTLRIYPNLIDSKSGNGFMGLYLQLEDASSLPSDLVLKTTFDLCVYEQLHNSRVIRPGNCYFRNQMPMAGFSDLVDDYFLKDLASDGYLLNDTCTVSVKIWKVSAQKISALKADRSNMFECLSLQGKPAAQGFTWKIEKFTKLPRPKATSQNFGAGDHKWNITVYPEGRESSDFLGIFLELNTTPALPFESEVFAEFSFSLLDQINGKHKKFTDKHRFSKAAPTSDLIELLHLEDFQDPLNGFLVENACIIEASVMVLGSSTGTDGLLL